MCVDFETQTRPLLRRSLRLPRRNIGVRVWKFLRGGHESARIAPKTREPLRGPAECSPKILKNSAFLMPLPAFWSGFLCIEELMNEKKV